MQRSRCFASRLLFATIVVFFSLPATAQAPAPPFQGQHQQERLVMQEVMIPMRDGVRLETVIFTPKQSRGPLPILLRRTLTASQRASVDWTGVFTKTSSPTGTSSSPSRFKSEGTFIMQRPP